MVESKFAYARFDGMTDSTDYDRTPENVEFRALFGSAAYVRCTSRHMDAADIAAREAKRLEATTPASSRPRPRRSL